MRRRAGGAATVSASGASPDACDNRCRTGEPGGAAASSRDTVPSSTATNTARATSNFVTEARANTSSIGPAVARIPLRSTIAAATRPPALPAASGHGCRRSKAPTNSCLPGSRPSAPTIGHGGQGWVGRAALRGRRRGRAALVATGRRRDLRRGGGRGRRAGGGPGRRSVPVPVGGGCALVAGGHRQRTPRARPRGGARPTPGGRGCGHERGAPPAGGEASQQVSVEAGRGSRTRFRRVTLVAWLRGAETGRHRQTDLPPAPAAGRLSLLAGPSRRRRSLGWVRATPQHVPFDEGSRPLDV